jgi:hypothetical protein
VIAGSCPVIIDQAVLMALSDPSRTMEAQIFRGGSNMDPLIVLLSKIKVCGQSVMRLF